LGLEHAAAWTFGRPAAGPAPLVVHAAEGEVRLTRDQNKETLTGPGSVRAETTGRFQSLERNTVPDWVTAVAVSEKDQKLAEDFARLFSPDGHILADIVSATENDSAVNKRLAIFAVKALGDLTFLVPILSRAKDRPARQSAVAALREFLAQGPEAARRLGEPLAEEFGQVPAQAIQKLLVGYAPEEAARRETLERLLDQISPREPSLAIRELALDNLMRITGKPDQGYDPDNPDDTAYDAWRALISKGESKPAPRRKTAE
jgi:hypothetical protein